MPIPKQSLLDRLELLSKTLLDGPPFHGEPAIPMPSTTDVGQSQKVKRLGLPLATPAPVLLRKAPKLDQPSFIRVQRETEFTQAVLEVLLEPQSLVPVLEASAVSSA